MFINDNKWLAPVILVVIGGVVWLYMEKATKKKKKK
jgi:cytochrome c-type biogenesis protein CcmH/NrfF